MANTYLTSDLLAKEAAAYFEVTNTFIKTGNRKYEGMYTQQTYTPGETINVRLDNRYKVQRGDTVVAQDIIDRKLSMTILPLFSIPIAYKPTDLQRQIGDFSETFIQPAVRSMCGEMNATISAGAFGTLYNHTGAVGTPVNTFAAINNTRHAMMEMDIPKRLAWYAALSMADSAALQNSLANQFNESLNTEILREAQLGRLAGFDIYAENSILKHNGYTAAMGTPLVKTAVVDGSTTVVIKGLTATKTGIITAGTLLTFAGVYKVDPVSHRPISQLYQAVVTADANSDGAGDATVTVSTAIRTVATDALQNCEGDASDEIPADTAITISQNYNGNICYTDMALYTATPRLERMDAPESSVFNDTSTGVSIRVSKTAEVLDNQNIMRLDCQLAYFWNPEMAYILMS